WSGGKHTQLEGGVRTPFIIRWPGNVPAGVVNSTSTISGLDWLPTMCSIAGIDIGSTEVEGEDITDILFGATRSPDRALFWKTHVENSPPSMLEGKWKMHGPLIASSNPDELFDLEADPEETIDVLAANPSIAASMSAAMDAWTATLPMSEFDNEPPVTPNSPNASAGTDQEVYDDDDDGAELVTLDGSGSSDPDGYISGYIWRESGQIIGHTDGPTVNLPVGVYTIEVEVTDYAGNTGFDTVIITVNAWESCGNETCDPGEDQCNCPEDCGTPPSTETNCTDGIDEDCDTDVDCADADCTSDPACEIDTVPPAPNPATFASAPAADSDSAISMTATTGSDATVPIEYLFTETSGNPGGTTSPWQTSTSYTDSGLNGSTQYTYTVTMRDALVNTGTASAPANATTDPAPAGDSNWTNGGGDRAWDNAINWSAGVPRSIDKAGIRNDSVSGPIIDTGTTALALNMVVGDFSSTADSVDMTGGSLTVGGWLILGYGVANNATFTISGGTVDTGGNLYTGFNGAGTLDMTGGSITVGSTFGIAQNTGSIGNVSLDGGTISSGSIVMTSDATMDITAGTLIVNGDVTSTINGYIGSGWITGYDGGGTVDVDYDISNAGKTTVTASNVANVNVPDVVGLAQATAESDIVAAGLVVGTVTTAYSGSVPAGDVISQNPTGGSSVASGSSVDIEVSLGVEMVAVPDVVGQAQATAESDIVAAGLVVGTVTTAYSGSVPAGDVISQDPVGSTSVEIGSSVDLVVST
ncbi:MAG: PASTA domain-containing protein, partial [Planctomycetes bacterium]|nr:PASTA domain-containing protein [Planctomycetota bacterium]